MIIVLFEESFVRNPIHKTMYNAQFLSTYLYSSLFVVVILRAPWMRRRKRQIILLEAELNKADMDNGN